MNSVSKRSLFIDITKIICTFGILFHHYQQYTSTYFHRGLNFYGGKVFFGYLVEVFFLISGWLMVPYVQRIKDRMSFSSFMYKRLIRLLPSVMVSTILYVLLINFYVTRYSGTIMFQDDIDTIGTIVTALGLGAWGITKNYHINNVCWYVSVLIFCYILMWVIVWVSKKTKIPVVALLCIPFAAGVIRRFVTDKEIPFYTEGMARGYIHFFGGLILGIIYNRFKPEATTVRKQSEIITIFRRIIESISDALLDVYLFQVSVLIMFYIASNHLPIRMVSGKTMLLYSVVAFAIGYLYHNTVGKIVYKLLKKSDKDLKGDLKA
ncbi:MAG: acyltransferase family protein [Lachnospiraceae bacterium]|nr:acyltransferase family protein [Lachnospiraceae bacterium]